jgi:hypothetical protein
VHEILQGNDTDQTLLLDYRNQRNPTRLKLTEYSAERLVPVGEFKHLAHGALDVSVAVGVQSIHDALASNNANQIARPDNRKVILQRVNGFIECVFERIGGRERAEIGKHDFAYAHAFGDRVKGKGSVLNLRTDKDKDGDQQDPDVLLLKKAINRE